MMFSCFVVLLLVSISSVSPISLSRNVVANEITHDAPFSLSQAQLHTVGVECPNDVSKRAGRTILFIHGTGGTGDESWSSGLIPAFHSHGYNGCFVNLPNRTLGDAQVTSEYVVSAIQRLYGQTGREQISIVGHSQGNLNIQWALNFWPSTRSMVASFASFSGDFQGTGEGPILEAVQDLAVHGTSPSVFQQSVTLQQQSRYLQALNKRGNVALVPTTSTYGIEDEILQPVNASTMLGSGGAAFTHVAVQEICPAMIVDHFAILINRVAFYLALDAFTHGSAASVERVKATYTDICLSPTAPGVTSSAIPDEAREAFREALAVGSEGVGTQGGLLSQRVLAEPTLMPYATE